MPVTAHLFNDHASENRYYYSRNSSGTWSASGNNPVSAGQFLSTSSAMWAMGISTTELVVANITDGTVFDDGLYVDVSRNSDSPYSNTSEEKYANYTSTGNPQDRSGGLLFKRSYDCIASELEEMPFEKEYLNDITPEGIFEYYKMTRQEDTLYVNTDSHCRIKPAPLRAIFGGIAGIRGQSADEDSAGFYKISLGDTVVNSS